MPRAFVPFDLTPGLQQWARLARAVLCTDRDDRDHLLQAEVKLKPAMYQDLRRNHHYSTTSKTSEERASTNHRHPDERDNQRSPAQTPTRPLGRGCSARRNN